MRKKIFFLAVAAVLAASGGIANATTYNIQITGSCDYLTLDVSDGIVSGQSTAPDCDEGTATERNSPRRFCPGPAC